jgi:hypothetical protein
MTASRKLIFKTNWLWCASDCRIIGDPDLPSRKANFVKPNALHTSGTAPKSLNSGGNELKRYFVDTVIVITKNEAHNIEACLPQFTC